MRGSKSVTSGKILFDGHLMNDEPPSRRNVAMAFENFGLYPHMTVQENIAYPLMLRNVPIRTVAGEVLRITRILKIEGELLSYPSSLSGGVRQRVSLARAMIRKPSVFLLDEPISHLDVMLRAEMRRELRRLHDKSSSTTIYVTHDQREALTMADRVLVMANGRLQQVDSPTHIYERPANRFVATFVGDPSMNLLASLVVRDADRLAVRLGGGNFKIGEEALGSAVITRLSDYKNVVVGVRPEHLIVRGSENCGLRGAVRTRETVGETALLTINADAHRLRVLVPIEHPVREGDLVALAPALKRLHFFHPETGVRIDAELFIMSIGGNSGPKNHHRY